MTNRASTLNAKAVIPSTTRDLLFPARRKSRSLALRLGMTVSFLVAFTPLRAQEMIHVRDLTIEDKAIPVRLMGYGLVIGLDGTGDKASGGKLGGMTVNSVVNLLKRFKVEIPLEAMKTKNVAAVLVTAEVSPYLRAGGRFQIHVSSLGDARSLRGGVLWMTPLQADISSEPVATAQGPLLMADMGGKTGVENSSRIPSGGLLEIELRRPQFAQSDKLLLRDPDVTMATRIANAINKEIGDGAAEVEDPGSIKLSFKGNKDGVAVTLARIQDLRVQPQRVARLIIDSRDGTIIAGGDLTVGEATVSHGGITITVGSATDTTAAPPGSLKMPSGTPVTRIASALHAVQAPPAEVAAIFESLRAIGAIAAEVIVR
jgi:flagellar P-ring protein precursor FlgI